MSWAHVYGPGQPDMACDLVAASVAEEFLKRDSAAQFDLRVMGGHGVLFLSGEMKSQADFDAAGVARRTLGSIDASLTLEPFVALESAAHELRTSPATVSAYATLETPEAVSPAVARARGAARELETRRLRDPEWFWLMPDYEVSAPEAAKAELVVRAGHADGVSLNDVRSRIADALAAFGPVRVNLAGADARGGLQKRVGASGRLHATDGLKLPSQATGAGLPLSHPANLGRWYARAAARELVAAGLGKAVRVSLSWFPLESRPSAIEARNEKGDRLESRIDASRFDLAKPPEGWNRPGLLSESLRHAHDGDLRLPWEG